MGGSLAGCILCSATLSGIGNKQVDDDDLIIVVELGASATNLPEDILGFTHGNEFGTSASATLLTYSPEQMMGFTATS